MSDDEVFYFSIPSMPPGKRRSKEEIERFLLDKLHSAGTEDEETLKQLAFFYGSTGQVQLALGYLDRLVAMTNDLEKRAGYYLAMGGNMETIENFEAAIYFYSQAMALEPENTPAWYFINNNLGYCLNHFGRFSEAEGYCRNAIGIDPERQNAYKNLGISLAGQRRYIEAARCFIQATRANAADGRALGHLEDLYAAHPEIITDFPDIEDQIKKCREAVEMVDEYRRKRMGE